MNWHDELPKFSTVDEDGNHWKLEFEPNPVYTNKARLFFHFNDLKFNVKFYSTRVLVEEAAQQLKQHSKNEEFADARQIQLHINS